MSKDTISIQMLIQGRELTLQQRGDAQQELNNIQSKITELEQENKQMLVNFLDEIRDYEHESGKPIYLDDRESSEFVDIFLTNQQN